MPNQRRALLAMRQLTAIQLAKWSALVALALGYLRAFSLEFDTRALLVDVHGMLGCVRGGRFSGCHAAGQFALMQKIPATVFALIGLSDHWILRALAYMSLGCFIALLLSGRRAIRARLDEQSGWLWIWLILVGPLPFYARSSFGEMLAAWATLAFTIVCIEAKRPLLTALLIFFAGLSKDTAVPFLILIACAGRLLETKGKRWVPRMPVWLGGSAAIALQIGFNFFRYSSPWNQAYLNPIEQVHSVAQMISNFGAIWLSPNGGLLFFWPAWVIAFGLFCVTAARSRVRAPIALALIVLGGLTLGFSKWYAPLGWVSWGPRLILPWLPSLLLITMLAAGSQISQRLTRWHLPLLIASLPQFFAIFFPGIKDQIFNHPELCSSTARIDIDPTAYYQCINSLMWPTHGNWCLLEAFTFWRHPVAFAAASVWGYFLYAWARSRIPEGARERAVLNLYFPKTGL